MKTRLSLLFMSLLWTASVFAADEVVGRAATQEDWSARIPIVLISIVIVLVVDGYFILPILRDRGEKAKVD